MNFRTWQPYKLYKPYNSFLFTLWRAIRYDDRFTPAMRYGIMGAVTITILALGFAIFFSAVHILRLIIY